MKIINVIELLDGDPIISQSFPIYEEQLSQEVKEAAEILFKKILKNNGIDDDESLNEYTKEKYFSDDNGYRAYIVYSYTD
jgi:hypothetical protein